MYIWGFWWKDRSLILKWICNLVTSCLSFKNLPIVKYQRFLTKCFHMQTSDDWYRSDLKSLKKWCVIIFEPNYHLQGTFREGISITPELLLVVYVNLLICGRESVIYIIIWPENEDFKASVKTSIFFLLVVFIFVESGEGKISFEGKSFCFCNLYVSVRKFLTVRIQSCHFRSK